MRFFEFWILKVFSRNWCIIIFVFRPWKQNILRSTESYWGSQRQRYHIHRMWWGAFSCYYSYRSENLKNYNFSKIYLTIIQSNFNNKGEFFRWIILLGKRSVWTTGSWRFWRSNKTQISWGFAGIQSYWCCLWKWWRSGKSLNYLFTFSDCFFKKKMIYINYI